LPTHATRTSKRRLEAKCAIHAFRTQKREDAGQGVARLAWAVRGSQDLRLVDSDAEIDIDRGVKAGEKCAEEEEEPPPPQS
jgi:hypothetical protein